jgi:uncharacterized membrane protein
MFGNSTCDCCGRDDIIMEDSERIESLEETVAELRAKLAEMTMFRDNAVENQKAMEDLFIDIKSNFDIFIRYHRKVVE